MVKSLNSEVVRDTNRYNKDYNCFHERTAKNTTNVQSFADINSTKYMTSIVKLRVD